jgi:ferredoxin
MGKEFGPSGYLSPEFTPGKCTACGICARMCPDYAIEVYDTGEGDKDK